MFRRLIIREVAMPFAAWTMFLCVLLFVMAFLRGSEVLLGSAVTLWDFAQLTFYFLPGFLVQAIPISFLLAILLGLGRLAEDGELRAMQSLGVSPTIVMGGPMLLGVGLSIVLAFLTSSALPWGQTMVRITANDIIRRNLMKDMKAGQFHEEVLGMTLYAGEVAADGRWKQVLVHDERDRDRPVLVLASSGAVRSTEWEDGINFELDDGLVHRSTRDSSEYAVVSFGHATIRVGVGELYNQRNQFHTAREEQSPSQLVAAIRAARESGQNSLPYEVTLHYRLGQMLMPLAFAVLGCPLAIMRRRGGRGWGALLTLGGYVGYYVVARLAQQLADKGFVMTWLAGQLPNLVFIALGALALVVISRRGAG